MWSHKFNLLLWKNWLLVKRHPIAAIFEIAFPVLIVVLFSYSRGFVDKKEHSAVNYESFSISPSNCYFEDGSNINTIGYSPDSDFYMNIMKLVTKNLKMKFETVPLRDAVELNAWIKNESIVKPVAAVSFESDLINPKHLKYTIRMPQDQNQNSWQINNLFYASPSKESRIGEKPVGVPIIPPYYSSCFLAIQNEIDRAFIEMLSRSTTIPSIKMQPFPYPSFVEDLFLPFAVQAFPTLLIICMMLSIKNIIKNIAIERETLLKESMKMMGLTSSMHWASWFTKSFILLLIPFTINCILFTTTFITDTPIFPHSNPLIIWIFLIIFIFSTVTFAFAISVFFEKSSNAVNVGPMIYFLSILPHTYFGPQFHSFPFLLKCLYCLIPNTNMGTAIMILVNSEATDTGITFTSLFKRSVDLRFSFGELLILMVLGVILQMSITFYVENAFPGEIGVAKPFYYPIIPFIKFLKKKIGYDTLSNESVLQDRRLSHPDFEEEPENLRAGIRIVNISKKFGHKFAVDKLCINMYENQITVLLGHNGAGKTTTMNLLTGLFSPSGGTAYINGKDIRTELDEARASLGICAQHNILFEELTVKEHLIFFCSLKGIADKRQITQEISHYTNLLGLQDKTNEQSKTLSGGMKRRLSIAIALCGKAKTVILDEPTSGMDPDARRSFWDLLLAEKKERTILLSTHFMDEADILGDRIAIMTEGRLRTVGSSFFLKKKFGTGYKLTVVKKEGFQIQAILNVLRKHSIDAEIESDGQTEATYLMSENNSHIFEEVFKHLEENLDSLRVSSFGCSLSTLEEVFLKLGMESLKHVDEPDERILHQDNDHGVLQISEDDLDNTVSGFTLAFYQIEAMLWKKIHTFRRIWKSLLYVAFFTILTVVVVMSAPNINLSETNPLEISLDTYKDTQTVLQENDFSFTLSYQSLFLGKNRLTNVKEDLSNYILDKYNESFAEVSQMYLIGATFEGSQYVTAWFNSQPYHTMPLSLNFVNRAILKSVVGNEFDLAVVNQPYNMPYHDSETHIAIYENPVNIIFALLIFFFLLTYWPVIFVAHYIKERESKSKLLQYISGTNRFIFWLTSFIFDYAVFMIICCAIVLLIGVYQQNHFATFKELCALVIISSSYGFSMLPLIYSATYLFSKHSTGETMVTLLNLLLGMSYGVYKILQAYFTEDSLQNTIIRVAYWIGLFFAPFNLVDQLKQLGFSFLNQKSIFTFDDETGIGKNIVINIFSGILFLTICIGKDHLIFERLYYKFFCRPRMLPLLNRNEIDSDVDFEIQRVKEMERSQIIESNLVLNGVTKFYGNYLAVNQLYLAIENRECFGLLGINGAGKTSTFKMLTGDELISSGDIWIHGLSLKNETFKVHKLIGYCPQFDAIIPELTGMETLKIFSLIRGIPKSEIYGNINKMANDLDFIQHLNKPLNAFSGGNKRKLSTCLALLGGPQLILLDEPTTGIDPEAKRKLWDVINRIRNSGRSVVITSHSMDECEALCTKIGIMVNGQFKCLGPVQHLKNKFSKGFILTIKMQRDDSDLKDQVVNYVQESFPSAELKEKYKDILTFHMTNANFKWSEVFGSCTRMKREIDVVDYSLTQMSLEQVFLSFSKSGLSQNNVDM